jgi:putative aldouronate transport system permease protein
VTSHVGKRPTAGRAAMYLATALFAAACIFPMLLTLVVSFTDEDAIIRNGYSFLPERWSVYAYRLIFHGGSAVLRSYGLSLMVTFFGTAGAVCITAMAAYTLANRQVRCRNSLALFFYVTMVFSAGMVPWYFICKAAGLLNNVFSLLVPSLLFNPFNLFLARTFMAGIPESLRESATIDGASEVTTAFRIYFPLAVPALATIALFYGLAYWNDWWNAIMLVDDRRLYPLQFLLLQLRSQIRMIRDLQLGTTGASSVTPPSESVKMATAVVTIGPIVLLYPYLQRYFISGLVVGSVKG